MTERELAGTATYRLAILRHAEEVSSNVALICRYCGITRQRLKRVAAPVRPARRSRPAGSLVPAPPEPAGHQHRDRRQDRVPASALLRPARAERRRSSSSTTSSRSSHPGPAHPDRQRLGVPGPVPLACPRPGHRARLYRAGDAPPQRQGRTLSPHRRRRGSTGCVRVKPRLEADRVETTTAASAARVPELIVPCEHDRLRTPRYDGLT